MCFGPYRLVWKPSLKSCSLAWTISSCDGRLLLLSCAARHKWVSSHNMRQQNLAVELIAPRGGQEGGLGVWRDLLMG